MDDLVVDLPQLRTADNNLVIYQPYQSPKEGTKDTYLRFLKIANSRLPKPSLEEEKEEEVAAIGYRPSLRVIQDLNGYSTVFMSGQYPCFVMKDASSPPLVIDMAGGPVQSLARMHTPRLEKGFIYIDDQVRHSIVIRGIANC